MRRLMIMAVSAALALGLFAAPAMAKPAGPSIVDVVVADDGEFDVLQAAVVRAGLVDLLDGNRQFTVFAPTDAAFEATFGASEAAIVGLIDSGALDADLAGILAVHVAPGERFSADVLGSEKIRTIGKSFLLVDGATLTASNTVNIIATDIDVRNGVIHVIDRVLLP